MAKKTVSWRIDNKLNFKAVDREYRKTDELARIKVGLQLLNWIVNGSPQESTVPPVLTGVLRGSGSVFYGSKLTGTTPPYNGKGRPNRSHSGKKGVITVGFDTAYAHRLHETTWEPGPVSKQSGDTGNKFIEKHLQADKAELLRLYSILMKKKF
jgi:hypothetical protein